MKELDYNKNFFYDMVMNIVDWYFNTEEGGRILMLDYPVYSIDLDDRIEYYNFGILKIELPERHTVIFNNLERKDIFFEPIRFYVDLQFLAWKHLDTFLKDSGVKYLYVVSDFMVRDKKVKFFYHTDINFEIDITKYQFSVSGKSFLISSLKYRKIRENEPNVKVSELYTDLKLDVKNPNTELYLDFMHYINNMYHKNTGISVEESKYVGILHSKFLDITHRLSIINDYMEYEFDYLEKFIALLDYNSYDEQVLRYLRTQVCLKLYMYGDSKGIRYKESEADELPIIKRLKSYYKRVELYMVGDCF